MAPTSTSSSAGSPAPAAAPVSPCAERQPAAASATSRSPARVRLEPGRDGAPLLEPGSLETLWLQVTGTICNIQCTHCFISCSPTNHAFEFMTLEDVERSLLESVALGVRDYYFTGGEPFLHPDIVSILSRSLDFGPTTVLTNGMVLKRRHVEALAARAARAPHALEFRVSIDGFTRDSHEAIRGEGSFDKALRGMALLLEHGFQPIVTAVRTWPSCGDEKALAGFFATLREIGYANPRVKFLPTLKMGAEVERGGGYQPCEKVTNAMLEGFDLEDLLCSHARVVTDRGVWVCPILVGVEDGRLGEDLAGAARTPFRLRHAACSTCFHHGAICSNAGAASPEAQAAGARS